MLRHIRLACLFLLAAACAAPRPASVARPAQADARSADQALAEEAAIASAMKAYGSGKTDYRISPADLLDISVFQEKDLTRVVRAGQNGTISFPLVGTVKVGGLPLIEAEALLAQRLSEFFINPQVTIFIKEYGNKKIYVLGEVVKPGAFDLPPESKLTVLEAVSLAGGFTPVAARDRTKIIRTAVEGKSQSLPVDVSAITKEGQKHKDLPLEPNDVVYIPQSFF